jgi:transposase
MNGFNPEQHRIETASALEILRSAENENVHAAYVGLDVHKETIAVAVAEPGRGEPIYRGEIANNTPRRSAVPGNRISKLHDKLAI